MEATVVRTDSGVTFRNTGGVQLRGTLVRMTRDAIVFEVYSPYRVVEPGESLENLTVLRDGRPVYTGGAAVGSVLSTGLMSIITATPLGTWPNNGVMGVAQLGTPGELLIPGFNQEQPLLASYQIAVSNLRSYLNQLSQWTAPIDLLAEVSDSEQAPQAMISMAEELHKVVNPRLVHLFGKWEEAWREVPTEASGAHRAFAQRELHPLTLCAPFVHRTYTKPLGFAGDYEMVNLILRNAMEGPSTYARVLHSFFIRTDAATGHRNRIVKLDDYLRREVRRTVAEGRDLRVMNLGCGPCSEIERFIRNDPLSDRCDLTLLDFNAETIEYAKSRLDSACRDSGRLPRIRFVQKSINDVLREAVRARDTSMQAQYDLVYCAGLFDYLSDKVCARLMQLMSGWLAADGLVLATNVHPRHTVHAILEDLLEWHLTLRTEKEMLALAAPAMGEPQIEVEEAGVNIIMTQRKTG